MPRGQPRHRAASALVRGRCPSPPPPREPLGAARGSRASPRRGACGGGVSPPPRRPRASLPLPTPPLQLGRAPCPRDGVSPSPAARAGSQRGGAARGMLRRLRGAPAGRRGRPRLRPPAAPSLPAPPALGLWSTPSGARCHLALCRCHGPALSFSGFGEPRRAKWQCTGSSGGFFPARHNFFSRGMPRRGKWQVWGSSSPWERHTQQRGDSCQQLLCRVPAELLLKPCPMSRIALQTLRKLTRGTGRKSKLVRVLLEVREAPWQGMGADCSGFRVFRAADLGFFFKC